MRKLRSVYVLCIDGIGEKIQEEILGVFTSKPKVLKASRKYREETGIEVRFLNIYRYTLDKTYD